MGKPSGSDALPRSYSLWIKDKEDHEENVGNDGGESKRAFLVVALCPCLSVEAFEVANLGRSSGFDVHLAQVEDATPRVRWMVSFCSSLEEFKGSFFVKGFSGAGGFSEGHLGVYMQPHLDCDHPRNKACRIHKALYTPLFAD
ncbi:unnamed protein product [Dovyalis caffra]|uniref:Uncharacterized protein n=1 Tax=Dovyalis caffra TaxID=77055 RepID=A0AAV1SCZ0_9ROSI|nr:unnamed protein product [Dovyalis caffra]